MKFRKATISDVPAIVEMIADDKLGKTREDFKIPLPDKYYDAYKNINTDSNQELIVVENDKLEVVGTMQLSFIQYLTYQGGIRAQIEAVRIRKDQRGKGLGKKLLFWLEEKAKEKGFKIIWLDAMNKQPQAFQFYEKLGYIYHSHTFLPFENMLEEYKKMSQLYKKLNYSLDSTFTNQRIK